LTSNTNEVVQPREYGKKYLSGGNLTGTKQEGGVPLKKRDHREGNITVGKGRSSVETPGPKIKK